MQRRRPAIKHKAKRGRVSLNRAVVGLLEEATGQPRNKPRAKKALRYDLYKFSGSWTKEEADEFDAHLNDQRKVDPKDWVLERARRGR